MSGFLVKDFHLPFITSFDLISITLSNNVPAGIEELNLPPCLPESSFSSTSLAALFGIRQIIIPWSDGGDVDKPILFNWLYEDNGIIIWS